MFNHEIPVLRGTLREEVEVEVHLVPDFSRGSLEVRIWWENPMGTSVTYPLRDFPGVYFSTFSKIWWEG
jgi:hypothetical protein